MSSRDTDFEFDFFEELRRRRRRAGAIAPRAGPGPMHAAGPDPPPRRLHALLRLPGLIAFAILIVVLLLLVQSCQEDAKHDSYSSYMTDMSAIARDSEDEAASSATC